MSKSTIVAILVLLLAFPMIAQDDGLSAKDRAQLLDSPTKHAPLPLEDPGDVLFSAPFSQGSPLGITMSDDGDIWVADLFSGLTEHYDQDLNSQGTIPTAVGTALCSGVAYDSENGTLWFLDGYGFLMVESDLDGNVTGNSFSIPAIGLPAGIEYDATTDAFYYVDIVDDDIYAVDRSGAVLDGYPVPQTDYDDGSGLFGNGLDVYGGLLDVTVGLLSNYQVTDIVGTDLFGANLGTDFETPVDQTFDTFVNDAVRSRIDPNGITYIVGNSTSTIYAVEPAVLPFSLGDESDPNPPEDVAAYSDHTTPSSIDLSWTDPSETVGGEPIGDFTIVIQRDGADLAEVASGTEAYTDGTVSDGTLYTYGLFAKLASNDSTSSVEEVSWYAGGHPVPGAPTDLACVATGAEATLTWTDPSVQADGTPLDDLDHINIYRDGELVGSASAGDQSFVDSPPSGFVYVYTVTAVDNEGDANESAASAGVECFVGDTPAYLVWVGPNALDQSAESGDFILESLANNGQSAFLTNDLFEFGDDLSVYDGIFVVLGIFSNNHVIGATDAEGPALESYLDGGGKIYLEGGDAFNYDPDFGGGYNIRPWFDLEAGIDGSGDMFSITGVNDLNEFAFVYAGENNWMDNLEPISSIPIWENDSPVYTAGVFYTGFNGGSGRSVGVDFSFGGLVDAGAPAPRQPFVGNQTFKDRAEWDSKVRPNPEDFEKKYVAADEDLARTRFSHSYLRHNDDGGIEFRANTKDDLMAAYVELFTVTGSPTIGVTPDSFDETLQAGDVLEVTMTLSNDGGSLADALTFDITESPNAPWLSADPASGEIGPNGSLDVTLTFQAPNNPGSFATTVQVSSNDPVTPVYDVAVSMEVIEASDIGVNPSSLEANLLTGQSEEQTFAIGNFGGSDLDWTIDVEFDDGDGMPAPKVQVELRPQRLQTIQAGVRGSRGDQSDVRLSPYAERSPNLGGSHPVITPMVEEIWDIQLSFDAEAATGGPSNAGAEFDGTYLYSTRWNTDVLHQYDLEGNVVEEFTISGVSGLRDLAYDGTYMYGGNSAFTIYEMDFETKTLVSSFSTPIDVRHIAYDEDADGFWIGNWSTDIVLVDRSGTELDRITGHGFGAMYGSAWDGWSDGGPYLWVFNQDNAYGGDPQVIHQFDLATGQLTGVNRNVQADFPEVYGGLAGGLWTSEGLVSGTVSMGGMFQGTPDTYFAYELGTAGPGGGSGGVFTDTTAGTTPPGGFSDVVVTFDATGFFGGSYVYNINVSSNDPDEPVVTVVATMNVTGAPSIAVDPSELDYGTIFINTTDTMSFVVENTGTDQLDVTSVTTSTGEFNVLGDQSFSLQPGETQDVQVEFAPTAEGEYGDQVVVSSNASNGDATVDVAGSAILQPEIEVDPLALSADLFTGEIDVQSFNIANVGNTDLIYSITVEDASGVAIEDGKGIKINTGVENRSTGPVGVKSSFDAAALLDSPKKYAPLPLEDPGDVLFSAPFSQGSPLGITMAPTGDIWVADLFSGLTEHYDHELNSQGTIPTAVGTALCSGIAYDTDNNSLWFLDAYGFLMVEADLDGNVTGNSFSVPAVGLPAGIEYDPSTDAFYYVDIVDDDIYGVDRDGNVLDGYPVPQTDYDDGSGLFGNGMDVVGGVFDVLVGLLSNYQVTDVVPTNYSGVNLGGTELETPVDQTFDTFVNDVVRSRLDPNGVTYIVGNSTSTIYALEPTELDLNVNPSGYVWVAPESGVVGAGADTDITVTFDADGLNGGTYTAHINIESNDVDEPVTTVVATLNVTGAADIGVDPASLDYGLVYTNYTSTMSFNVNNVGTAELEVTSIGGSNSAFNVLTATPFTVAAGESQSVEVEFAPTETGVFTDELVVESNATSGDASVGVAGIAQNAPILGLNTGEIDEGVPVTDSMDVELIMTNDAEGDADNLDWSAKLSGAGGGNALIWSPNAIASRIMAKDGSGPISEDELTQNEDPLAIESSVEIAAALTEIGVDNETVTDLLSVDLSEYGMLFVVLGQFDVNYVVLDGSGEATAIEDYIANGGNVYLEGGDTWFWDPGYAGGHDFGPTFGIDAIDDGAVGGELTSITGSDIVAGHDFDYNVGTDNYPDHLVTVGTGVVIHSNTSPAFDCGIANETASGGKTIGVSHEFKELIDNGGSRTDLMQAYVDFFGGGGGAFAELIGDTEGAIGPGDANALVVRLRGLDVGDTTYNADLTLTTNDPELGEVVIPVTVNVGPDGISLIDQIPTTFDVSRNYPNPFNPTTNIKYQLPKNSDVKLVVYNMLGQKVKTLVDKQVAPGYHNVVWDATNDAGNRVASGIYIYRFEAGDFNRIYKMVLLK